MKEYLSTLNTRNKWNEEKGNIAPGDVVLMVDPGNSRGHWPLSRIQEVFPGPDGQDVTFIVCFSYIRACFPFLT